MKDKISRIRPHVDVLKTIGQSKKIMRNTIIRRGNKKLIQAICECCDNALIGNIPLDDNSRVKLYKYRNTIRKLVQKSTLNDKKDLIIQNGGFLQFLI